MGETCNGKVSFFYSRAEEDEAHFMGESRVTDSVFEGGKHTWRLWFQLQLVNRNGKWMIGRTVAPTHYSDSKKPKRLKENLGAAGIFLAAKEIAAIDKETGSMTIAVFGGR